MSLEQEVHRALDAAMSQYRDKLAEENRRLRRELEEKNRLINTLMEVLKAQDKGEAFRLAVSMAERNTSVAGPAADVGAQDVSCPEEFTQTLCIPSDFGILKVRVQGIRDMFHNNADIAICEQVFAAHGVIRSNHRHKDFVLLMQAFGIVAKEVTQKELKRMIKCIVSKIASIHGVAKERYKGWDSSDDQRKARKMAQVLPEKYTYMST